MEKGLFLKKLYESGGTLCKYLLKSRILAVQLYGIF